MSFKISTLIIGLVIMGMLTNGFMIFMSHGADQYNISSYNESELEAYDQLSALHNQSETLRASTDLNTDQSISDILGNVFNQGYGMLRISLGSLTIAHSLTNSLVSSSGLTNTGFIITGIGTILTILFIFALISNITKRGV